jgi:hypothetical protein
LEIRSDNMAHDACALAPNKNKTHRQSLNKQRANNFQIPKKWLTTKEDAISWWDKIWKWDLKWCNVVGSTLSSPGGAKPLRHKSDKIHSGLISPSHWFNTNGYIAHVPTGTFILSCFENICASLWRNELKCSHLCVTI